MTAVSAHAPGSLRAWLLALRPKTLPAAVVPVAVGAACSWTLGGLRPNASAAALLGALLLQIGSNFANDVYDYEKGADTEARVGPERAVQSGWISPQAMKTAMVGVLLAAALVGAYLAHLAGPAIWIIGIASILSAVAYTGGPYPLGYHGLGDVFVFLFFGFVAVAGTVLVNLGRIDSISYLAAIPVGSLATAILVVNNVRDVETDKLAGKRTLAVRWGRQAGVWEYRLLMLAAYATPAAMLLLYSGSAWLLLPWLSLPLALRLHTEVISRRGSTLNPTLARTAQLMMIHGLLFAVGIVLGLR